LFAFVYVIGIGIEPIGRINITRFSRTLPVVLTDQNKERPSTPIVEYVCYQCADVASFPQATFGFHTFIQT